jgi:hypothetical protein
MIPKSGHRFSATIMRKNVVRILEKAEGAERREAQISLSSAHTDTRCRWSMLRARKRALSGRARLPALRSDSRRDFDIPAQLQAMLPGTWSKRALPVLSCPSPAKAPRASVVMPKRMMPKAARVRGYEARPQAPRRLHFRIVSRNALDESAEGT